MARYQQFVVPICAGLVSEIHRLHINFSHVCRLAFSFELPFLFADHLQIIQRESVLVRWFKHALGCEVLFGQGNLSVAFPAHYFSLPIVGSDENLHRLLNTQALDLLAQAPAVDNHNMLITTTRLISKRNLSVACMKCWSEVYSRVSRLPQPWLTD